MTKAGRWCAADLRPWGLGRVTLRNPKAPGWPNRGERTESADIAQRWALAYVDLATDDTRRAQLGRAPRYPTLADAAETYLAGRERNNPTRTYLGNRAALNTQFIPFIGGDLPLDAIDSALVQRWVDRLVMQGYELSTVDFYMRVVRGFFRAASAGALNPTKDVTIPSLGERDVRPWTDEEIEKLRTAADKLDRTPTHRERFRILASYRRFLEAALNTGLRSSELVALDWPAFRESDKTVRVTQQVKASGHELTTLKGKRNRTALVLPDWWTHHRHDLTGRVLVRPGVTAFGAHVMHRWITLLLDAAKLNAPGIGVHSLRHTYSRLFLEKGGRLEELQKSLGHKHISITEEYYGHLTEQSAATLARWRIYGEDTRPQLVREVRGTSGKVSGSSST